MEAVAAAVEDAGLDAGRLGALGEQLADPLGLLRAGQLAKLVLGPGDGHERPPRVVVDQLRADPAVRAKHGDAGPLGGAAHLRANAAAAAKALLALGLDGHR